MCQILFLDQQLHQFEVVFYLLGNYEPYGITFPKAKAMLYAFEADTGERRRLPNSTRGKHIYWTRRDTIARRV